MGHTYTQDDRFPARKCRPQGALHPANPEPLSAYIGKHACLNVIMVAMPECATEEAVGDSFARAQSDAKEKAAQAPETAGRKTHRAKCHHDYGDPKRQKPHRLGPPGPMHQPHTEPQGLEGRHCQYAYSLTGIQQWIGAFRISGVQATVCDVAPRNSPKGVPAGVSMQAEM